MIGINWKREQGPADPLPRRMLEEAGMEKCYPYSWLHEAFCHIGVDVCPYIHKETGDPENR